MGFAERLCIVIIVSPLCLLCLHMVLSRILKQRLSAQLVTVMSIVLGYIPLLAMVYRLVSGSGILGSEQGWHMHTFSRLYLPEVFLFHIFNMSETCRQILYEIYAHLRYPFQDKASYGPQDMFPVRLNAFSNRANQLNNGRYVLRMPLLALCASIIAVACFSIDMLYR